MFCIKKGLDNSSVKKKVSYQDLISYFSPISPQEKQGNTAQLYTFLALLAHKRSEVIQLNYILSLCKLGNRKLTHISWWPGVHVQKVAAQL